MEKSALIDSDVNYNWNFLNYPIHTVSAKPEQISKECAILLMVIGTTFLAPVLLRIVLKDKPPNDGNKISDDVAADPVGLL